MPSIDWRRLLSVVVPATLTLNFALGFGGMDRAAPVVMGIYCSEALALAIYLWWLIAPRCRHTLIVVGFGELCALALWMGFSLRHGTILTYRSEGLGQILMLPILLAACGTPLLAFRLVASSYFERSLAPPTDAKTLLRDVAAPVVGMAIVAYLLGPIMRSLQVGIWLAIAASTLLVTIAAPFLFFGLVRKQTSPAVLTAGLCVMMAVGIGISMQIDLPGPGAAGRVAIEASVALALAVLYGVLVAVVWVWRMCVTEMD